MCVVDEVEEDVKETGKCQTGIVIFLGSLRTGKI